MARFLLVIAVAGCNQIYGLDATELPPDAPAFPVEGELLYRWAENTPAGLPVVMTQPLNARTVVYLSAGKGSALEDIAIDAEGRFAFTRAAVDDAYRVVMTIDGNIYELHSAAPQLRFITGSVGRFDPLPVTSVPITVAAAPNTVKAAVASTGIWSYASSPLFGAFNMNWRTPEHAAGRHGLVDTARGDALYVLDYEARTSVEGDTYIAIAGAERHSRKMVDGTAMTFPAPPRVTPRPCSKLFGAHAEELRRFRRSLASPEVNCDESSQFCFTIDAVAINAIASLETGVVGQTELATVNLFQRDVAFTPTVHNPIEGSTAVSLTFTLFTKRLRHPDSWLGAELRAVLVHTVPLDCDQAQTAAVPAIGIPGDVELEGIALASDTVTIEPTTREIELAWRLVEDGPVDAYTITLLELGLETFGTTSVRHVRTYQTVEQRLPIDATTFVRGRYYFVQITAVRGLPNAKTGDFATTAHPLSAAQLYTSMFRIR